MKYSEFVEVYEELAGTTKRLEKIEILSKFLKKLKKDGKAEWIYLLRGKVLPDYDMREFGISRQLIIKIISKASGISANEVVKKFNKIGDLGQVAENLIAKKKQTTLFSSRLTTEKVFTNLQKLFEIEGRGSVEKKNNLVAELLTSASGKEVKYIVRTVLNDLRIGVQDSTLIESIADAFFHDDKKEMKDKIEYTYDLSNDFAEVFNACSKGKKTLDNIGLAPGKPVNVMLPVKVAEIKEAFRIVGKPSTIEHKYDGFRVVISKKGEEINLFTRRLENVTKQFPDVVKVVKKNVKGGSFILDSEVIGYDPKTHKNKPFEAISQRIKRKYDIERLEKELPVEVNVFDILYYDGKSVMSQPFKKRREIIEKIVKNEKYKIRVAKQIVTGDEKIATKFYHEALKIGEEGIMFKKLDAPYKSGRHVGYIVKMKPEMKDLDLVIVAAEHGTGKRAGWLTSYIIACRDEKGDFLEVGKVASGLKEKEEQGTTYKEMTKILKPLIESEEKRRVKVKPEVVVAVTYQNIQKSPTYSSGYALRFPRITNYRPDRNTKDIATLDEIKKLIGKK